MRNIQLVIEYDGTNFQGWQLQKKGRTVQGELQKALKQLLQESVRLAGASRTDSGVHAQGQVANFTTKSSLSAQEIQKALNALTPEDIIVTDVREVKKTFHAQYSAKRKTYRYTILNRPYPSALNRHFTYFHPHKLNVFLMRREAKFFIGRKNFKSFQASDPSQKLKNHNSTVRKIYRIDIHKKNSYIYIDVEADGFLYKMVRNIIGTLIAIGNGKLPKGSVKHILAAKDRTLAPATAPACGLCLMKVVY